MNASWADWKSKKLSFWSLIFSYSTQQQIISQSDCDVRWKVDNWRWPTQWLDLEEAPKHFSKPRLPPKISHGHCLVVCCQSDPLQLSECWWNHCIWEASSANQSDAPKTATPAAATGQQKRPSSSLRQCMTAYPTTNASKIRPQNFASSPYSLDLSQTDYHFFKHLNNFLKGKCFHNQQETEIAFQEFIKPEAWIFILH